MTACDCLIVGGGPAGSAAAWVLVRAGLDVVVLDKASFPRPKVCAGWITPEVFAALEASPAEYAGDRVLQPINGFRISRMGFRDRFIDYGRTVSYGIRRSELDDFLLRRAGARLRLGEPLRAVERDGGEWVVNGEIRSPVIVGAGGHFCPLARHLGAELGRGEPIVAAEEIEVPLTPAQRAACTAEPGVPELLFTADFKGYGWSFLKGEYLNVGLGRRDPHRFRDHLRHFVAALEKAGKIPPDLPARFRGHAYLLRGESPRRLVADGALLVGDAAGLAYPVSGEGIRPAVESGLLAARVLLAAGGDYRQARLEPYAELLTRRFGPATRASGPQLSRWLPERWRWGIAGRLMTTRWFARRVVVERWFLRRHQPPLLGTGRGSTIQE